MCLTKHYKPSFYLLLVFLMTFVGNFTFIPDLEPTRGQISHGGIFSVNFTLVNESKEPLLHDKHTRYADFFPASHEQVYYGSSQQPHNHRHHHRRRPDGLLSDECSCTSSVPLPVSSHPGSTWQGGSMELDVVSKMPQQTKQFHPVLESSENC